MNHEEIRQRIKEIKKLEYEERTKILRPHNEKFNKLKQEIQDQCEHEYQVRLEERIFGYVDVNYCWHCGHSYVIDNI